MIFSSILFLFRFLPLFIFGYFVAPKRMRNLILFLGSLIFYAWGEPVYVVLMLFSTVSDFIHGLFIEKCRLSGRKGTGWLVSSLIINLFMLGFFKYADFLIGTVNAVFGTSIPELHLPLPIGISFYTFQTMSYSIDVYRGEVKAQKNILDFGVFVTMFPQLIAGPIVKYRTVAESLSKRSTGPQRAAYGVRRFIIGLGKKVLLANNIGQLWTQISEQNMGEMTASMAWIGIMAFGLQIYFDFSGYSDMAIGLGEILGFRFPENFNYPYISRSITEFWRRWHISLSSWFKEYVYIPLGGNRKGSGRQIFNILLVWALTGIWHGAGWNFLFWGLWFALFLILEKLFLSKIFARLPGIFGWLYTIVLVLIGWVFFALESLPKIAAYLKAMFGLNGAGLYNGDLLYLFNNYWLLLLILIIGATPLCRNLICRNKTFFAVRTGEEELRIPESQPWLAAVAENVVLVGVLLLSIAYIVEASYNPFLYFRF